MDTFPISVLSEICDHNQQGMLNKKSHGPWCSSPLKRKGSENRATRSLVSYQDNDVEMMLFLNELM